MSFQFSPFHVDGTRYGGKNALQRHAFGFGSGSGEGAALAGPRVVSPSSKTNAPAPQRAPRFLPPPPKRLVLGQGQPTPPALSEDQKKALQAQAANAIEALQLELEATKAEADLVSGPALRNKPEAYKEIPLIGPYFTPQEVRTQITLDAGAIEDSANRMLHGAASSYLSVTQTAALGTLVGDAQSLVTYIQQFDLAPITGAKTKLSQDHVGSHVNAANQVVAEVEKGVVTGEASSVPVVEPSGKLGLGGILALAALIAVGAIIAEIA
jgi:hypothetical protein